MKALERLLAGNLPPDTTITDTVWQSRGLAEPAFIILCFLVILAFQLVILYRDTRARGLTALLTLAVLRSAATFLIAVVLLAPVLVLTLTRERPATMAVLVDTSRSMTFRDGTEGAQSRWDQVSASLASAVLPALDERSTVRLFGFAAAGDALTEATALEDLEPAGRATEIGAALEQMTRRMATEPIDRVMVISDGRNTGGANPIDAVARFRREGTPVDAFLAGGGRIHNLRLEPVRAEPYAFLGDRVQYEVRVAASGYANDVIPVILSANGVEQQQVQIQLDAAGATARLQFQPEEAGKVRLAFEVPVQTGEALEDDNRQELEIEVLEEKMRVLVIEEQPRWEYRFLHTALLRDPRVEPSFLLSVMDFGGSMPEGHYLPGFPETFEELNEYDLVLVGDIPRGMLDTLQQERLRDYVMEEGGSVLFVAGRRHGVPFAGTPLDALLPVEVDRLRVGEAPAATPLTRSYQLRDTPLGSGHPLLAAFQEGDAPGNALADLPGMYWHLPASDTGPGAMVLAEHSWAGEGGDLDPLFVFQYAGRGRSLYMGFDETWRWRFKFGNRFYYQFWGNVIQVMAMPHLLGQKDLVQIDVPQEAVAGEVVNVGARVVSESGAPVQVERQSLEILDEGGQVATATLYAAPDQPGYYRGELVFQSSGSHRLSLADYAGEGEATVRVREAAVELRDPNPNPELMRRLAAVGGGVFAEYADWSEAAGRLEIPPVETRWIEERSIWDRGWLLLLATGLLGAEWVLRRIWRLL